MKFLRVTIEGWMASFRYPTFISGFQPTLPSPPLSTIYGLLSAAKGEIVNSDDNIHWGYVFNSDAKAVDLESIYEIKGLKGNKSNVVKREFLFNPKMYLYLDNLEYEKYFKKPAYPLVLGRSTDLAMVSEIKEINLEKEGNVKLGKTILPYGVKGSYGVIQSLPTHFTNTIPRKAVNTKPYIFMKDFFNYEDEIYYDSDLDWGVWIY